MKKYKLITLAVTLLLLVVTFWVRSYYVRDIVSFGAEGGSSHVLQSIQGRVHLISHLDGSRSSGETTHSSDRLSPDAIWNGAMSGYPANVEWHLGCVFQRYTTYHLPYFQTDEGFTTSEQLVVIPYAWMVILLGIFPVARLVQMARQSRRNSKPSACASSTDKHHKDSELNVAPAPQVPG